ncbi:MAG TPA: hypothetical protein VID94_00205 [Acidimicrobiales bacterium]|jgi:hypothetical protein
MDTIVLIGLIVAVILCVIEVARSQNNLTAWAGIVGFGVLVLSRVVA